MFTLCKSQTKRQLVSARMQEILNKIPKKYEKRLSEMRLCKHVPFNSSVREKVQCNYRQSIKILEEFFFFFFFFFFVIGICDLESCGMAFLQCFGEI